MIKKYFIRGWAPVKNVIIRILTILYRDFRVLQFYLKDLLDDNLFFYVKFRSITVYELNFREILNIISLYTHYESWSISFVRQRMEYKIVNIPKNNSFYYELYFKNIIYHTRSRKELKRIENILIKLY